MQLIHVKSGTGNGADASSLLLGGIASGLLIPSVPLSDAAARQLHAVDAHNQQHQQHAGTLLKSLPVELLYDDRGLQLFDHITYLPEYYLTEAEASILRESGADIVRSCVPQDGALLVELGAGSMRKTRLLLDAVQAAGRKGVTFAALDLCEHSLREALTALQGCCGSGVRLIGLVGTYDQGLDYLAQQDQLAHAQTAMHTQQQQPQQKQAAAVKLFAAAPAGPEEEENDDTDSQPAAAASLVSSSTTGMTTYSAETRTASETSLGNSNGTSDISSNSSSAPTSPVRLVVDAGTNCAPRVIMWLGSSIGNSDRQQAVSFLQQVKSKAMRPGDFLLLGIDRRNASQAVAAAYNDSQGVTRQFILNGLQHCARLLDSALGLYSDNTAAQPPDTALEARAGSKPASRSASTNSSNSTVAFLSSSAPEEVPQPEPESLSTQTQKKPVSSLDPSCFDYFSLYNEELGRHEAYYLAKADTSIRLPAAAAALTTTAVGVSGQQQLLVGARCGVGDDDSSNSKAGAGCVCGGCACGKQGSTHSEKHTFDTAGSASVAVAAGELISIEFSYKYSEGEVQQLAGAAGLVRLQAWSDAGQRYDLHLLQSPPA